MFLKTKKSNVIRKKLFNYFKIEKTQDGKMLLLGDFADKEFCHWLQFIHNIIQKAFNEKMIDDNKIENYLNIIFYIGGQRVDIAIIKDGKKGPHELLQEANAKAVME